MSDDHIYKLMCDIGREKAGIEGCEHRLEMARQRLRREEADVASHKAAQHTATDPVEWATAHQAQERDERAVLSFQNEIAEEEAKLKNYQRRHKRLTKELAGLRHVPTLKAHDVVVKIRYFFDCHSSNYALERLHNIAYQRLEKVAGVRAVRDLKPYHYAEVIEAFDAAPYEREEDRRAK